MAEGLNLFPTLTDELFDKIRFETTPYEFSYQLNEEEFYLSDEAIEGSNLFFKIIDEKGIWNPDENNLILRKSYKLRTYSCLFGPDGIACRGAEIGLAIMWTSQSSKQRGIIEIGSISKSQKEEASFQVEYNFGEALLRGSIEFSTIFYLKKSGNPTLAEEHLANDEGYILGELDKTVIMIDGNGSMFPIYEVNEPSQPLWYVKCDWEDPAFDMFSECVSININTAHRCFKKYLDRNKKTFNDQLLKEVMAGALMVIIMKMKESAYWVQTVEGTGYQIGSVCEAVNYFVSVLEWNTSSPEHLSISIRKFLDARM